MKKRKGILSLVTVVLLFGYVNSVCAAATWKFSVITDEMTDKKECHLDAPTKNIQLSFQGDAIYIGSKTPFTIEATHGIIIRVDKNQALTIITRMVTPNIMVIDAGGTYGDQITGLVSQFMTGSSFLLKTTDIKGISSDKGSFNGFQVAYEKYKSCLSS